MFMKTCFQFQHVKFLSMQSHPVNKLLTVKLYLDTIQCLLGQFSL